MKRLLKPSYLAALALTVAALAWVFTGDLDQAMRYYGFADDKADAPPPAAADRATPAAKTPKALTAVRVRRSHAEDRRREIDILGRTDVIFDAEVTAETSGRIVELAASKGQWLKKGDVILKLEMADRKARLREAEAKVEFERIGYEAARKLSKKQFQSEVKLAQEKAELELARAELATIRLDIARTVIRAPVDGYLDTLPVAVGDYLAAGAKVVTLVNPDPLRVVAQVSERDVGALSVGDEAKALTPDDAVFLGRVKYIAQQADPATRTYRVDVWIDNPGHKLRDGQTMELFLPAGVERAHRVSPAVLTLDDRGVVGIKLVDGDGTVRFHAVRIVGDTTQGVWLAGLPDIVDVITVGQEFVKAGQRVKPVMEPAGPDDAGAGAAGGGGRS